MWCNTDTLRGFRGIYRYNIFQNDLTKHGVIDWRTNHKESMVYNNVFYFGELPEDAESRVFMGENAYCNGKSEAKFYNNIFYNLDDFVLVQAVDYTKMTSVTVTEEWIKQNINTNLNIALEDGFGTIKYVKPENNAKAPETTGKKQNNNQLETDNVILISDKKVNTKYKLKEENLKDHEVATKVDDRIEKDLVSLYDVTVYNGKKQVPMKNGKYTIKIKLDGNIDNYNNYQIIYVNDDGEIEEYIDGRIEGEYIVFNTSHLSQYGVIASPIVQEELATKEEIKEINPVISNIFKISILVVFTLGAACLVGALYYKCYTLSNKNIKKRA
jgi:hypothetical protein